MADTTFVTRKYTGAGRTAADAQAFQARVAQRNQMSADRLSQARQVWQSGNAGDKAMLFKDPLFTNQLINSPQLQKEFGFSDAQDVKGTINGLYAGNLGAGLYDPSSPAFSRLGGTQGQYVAPNTTQPPPNPSQTGSQGTSPTYPLPGATPGKVPGTTWPSNNMPPGGPQQYFPPPNYNYLSSNNPQGAVYQPTVPGGKMGGQPGKMGAAPPQQQQAPGKMGGTPGLGTGYGGGGA